MNNTMNAMHYKGYTASMVFDAEDKIIVGRVLDIDDIISFHGESVFEFEANFHAVVDDYITACAKLRSKPQSPPAASSCCVLPLKSMRQPSKRRLEVA